MYYCTLLKNDVKGSFYSKRMYIITETHAHITLWENVLNKRFDYTGMYFLTETRVH